MESGSRVQCQRRCSAFYKTCHFSIPQQRLQFLVTSKPTKESHFSMRKQAKLSVLADTKTCWWSLIIQSAYRARSESVDEVYFKTFIRNEIILSFWWRFVGDVVGVRVTSMNLNCRISEKKKKKKTRWKKRNEWEIFQLSSKHSRYPLLTV